MPTPGGPIARTLAFSSMNRSVASSSTRRRSSDGWALKSNSSSVLVEGNPASRSRLARRRSLGRVDLDVEQVVQELGVAGLGLLRGFERGGELLGRGGELEVGEVAAQLLVGGVLVHRATLAICA